MTDTTQSGPMLSRRDFLKVGLLGAAFLATAGVTASLSSCSADGPASGFAVLRETDMPFLRAVLPVLLTGAVAGEHMPAAVAATIQALDDSLDRFSPESRQLTLQLFDVLAMPLTRGPLTGIWGRWEHADAAAIQSFLHRWQHSAIGMLKMGHAALLQLVMLAWYGNAQSWAHCAYPGPPRLTS